MAFICWSSSLYMYVLLLYVCWCCHLTQNTPITNAVPLCSGKANVNVHYLNSITEINKTATLQILGLARPCDEASQWVWFDINRHKVASAFSLDFFLSRVIHNLGWSFLIVVCFYSKHVWSSIYSCLNWLVSFSCVPWCIMLMIFGQNF